MHVPEKYCLTVSLMPVAISKFIRHNVCLRLSRFVRIEGTAIDTFIVIQKEKARSLSENVPYRDVGVQCSPHRLLLMPPFMYLSGLQDQVIQKSARLDPRTILLDQGTLFSDGD